MFFKRKAAQGYDPAAQAVAERSERPARERLGWFEKRDRRRRRRIMFEEVVGWILVPAFIYLIYLGFRAIGGIPKELIDFGNELIGIAMKGGA